ncbi:TPA_asm: iron-containing alcohol dehydrogenase [Listeria monocytogenes]|uniref:iron-containing alcohol dehydrogenase n=1 Tax=Listeria monocytogenes TaxID=1639 RepID=UPI00076670D5|nr:iron-containing alcohol dehydrogenase [Listeria monocytogenes]EAC4461046.1 iron-containing alcohol dehydrogenase [Listeria monocytogenes]EAC6576713.1 iron-containing alcohol dehydrogenase [Listeria monocytogenes]EAC6588640.1 iron-containing alcohol dehydrogenase [Listeria monocytogenes]EAD5700072.1 iron-containing alcohol dehydrogenase [Listeria monocytogenes]EAD5703177.1 iron-containing alcohol dehydrogenase [Listeria monocytogenes]
MNNFDFQSATNILFGKGQIEQLAKGLTPFGNKVLLIYGGGSIKENGIYTEIQKKIGSDFNVIELGGVEPNPRIETVKKGVELCRENKVDVILAAGGGSVIDCAKAISAGIFYDGNPWDFTSDSNLIGKTLPIISILTISATGSEMNGGAVITNLETKEKLSFFSRDLTPRISILDPTYTFSVPKYQTIAGSSDILSHLFENYFDNISDTLVQDSVSEGLMRTVYHYTPLALENPNNYEARANLMWASSLAMNGLTGSGKSQTMPCHAMEHELSAYYDITHGIGLAIITPRWMKHCLNESTAAKFAEFGHRVFGIEQIEDKMMMAEKAIELTYQTFKSWGVPMTLGEVGIDDTLLSEMAKQTIQHRSNSVEFVPLEQEDILAIFTASLVEMY